MRCMQEQGAAAAAAALHDLGEEEGAESAGRRMSRARIPLARRFLRILFWGEVDAGSSWADDGRHDASEAAKCACIWAAPAASGNFGQGWCASKADVAADVAGGGCQACVTWRGSFSGPHMLAGLVLAWRRTTLLWSP